MMKKVTLYIRSFNTMMSIFEQKKHLKIIAIKNNWKIVGCYIDRTKSGYFHSEVKKQYLELVKFNYILPHD